MITAENILEEAAKLDPNRENPRTSNTNVCLYTSGDGEHCIVGQIFVNLDIDIPQYDDPNNMLPILNLFNTNPALREKFNSSAIAVLARLQVIADGKGNSWGTAFNTARRLHEEGMKI